jgi:hypothetical protein
MGKEVLAGAAVIDEYEPHGAFDGREFSQAQAMDGDIGKNTRSV